MNSERSERGLVAVGVIVRGTDGTAQAGLSVSMPSVRYDPQQLRSLVATLGAAGGGLEADLATATWSRNAGKWGLWVLCLAVPQQIGRGSGWRCPAAGSGRSSLFRARAA